MIRVGIVGLGFMGWIHWLAYQKVRGAKVAAICTRSEKRRAGDWRDIRGNFGPPGERVDLAGIATCREIDDLVGDPTIDLVDITLPTSLHADVAIRALGAGKHVLCEKPMALRLADCRRMTAAAQRAGRQLFIAHVLPFFPEYDWARRTIASGKYGRLRGGAFRRVIADPKWIDGFWSPDHIGGPMLDLHVHDAHFIRLLFGMPEVVTTQGRLRNGPRGRLSTKLARVSEKRDHVGVAEFWHSQFRFADEDLVVETTSGTIDQQGRPFDHGFEIHLERATLAFQFAVIGDAAGYLCEPTFLDDKGKVQRPKLSGGDPLDAFAAELREVVRCVQQGRASEILGAALAQDAIRICDRESASLLRRRPVKF